MSGVKQFFDLGEAISWKITVATFKRLYLFRIFIFLFVLFLLQLYITQITLESMFEQVCLLLLLSYDVIEFGDDFFELALH